MWINPEVDLPEPLLTAQRSGRLVVFAGAGVSMGPPSNLPDFAQLALLVSGGTLARAPEEPLDRFLGRLEDAGVDIQGRTRSIVGDPRSQPRPLHYDLLRLFDSAATTRIVTTNFDRHFRTAGTAIHGSSLEFYCGPALPLGRDFAGVIDLHGSVDKPQHRLVLSDSDFGRAYLTDAWATRMLVGMFSSHCVLFVGYSHEDPVMSYLARSLVPGTERYTLVPPDSDDWWRYLGITPVHFPRRVPPDEFGALGGAISAWAIHSRMGFLDHEQRIRQTVAGPPPLDRETTAYIAAALTDTALLRFFVRAANAIEWLQWVEERGLLMPLFNSRQPLSESSVALGTWVANFAVSHPSELIALIQRNGPEVHPVVWSSIARALALAEPPPSGPVSAAWVGIITAAGGLAEGAWFLDHLISKCSTREHALAALLIFERQTRPRLRLAHPWPGTDETAPVHMRGELTMDGNRNELERAWKESLIPNLDILATLLVTMLARHLTYARVLLDATGQASAEWDRASYGRKAIEPHAQDVFDRELDLLIDAARDTLEWLLENRIEEARVVRSLWLASGTPLLVRLGIHGLTADRSLSGDEAISEILSRNWLYAFPLKHEVFRLLAKAYPAASEGARRSLIAAAVRGRNAPPRDSEVDEVRSRDYERYNLAVWIVRSAPGDSIAREYLDELQGDFADFAPREHPDLHSWSGGVRAVVPISPRSVEDLLGQHPPAIVDWLLSYEAPPGHGDEPDREGLLGAVREACVREVGWSIGLSLELVRLGSWDSDLWTSILRAWQTAELSTESGSSVLGLLEQNPQLDTHHPMAIADVLEKLTDDSAAAVPADAFGVIENLADRLLLAVRDAPAVDFGRRDWLQAAINHPGGRVAIIWLKALSARAVQEDVLPAMPQEYSRRFEGVLRETYISAQFARIVLASKTSFLYSIDAGWTREYVLPLFDWSRDPVCAEQVWHGFLEWGSWQQALFADMQPFLREGFTRMGSELSEQVPALVDRLAQVAVFSALNPLESGWLQAFTRQAEADTRASWIRHVGAFVADVTDDAKRRAWAEWMKPYWTDRLSGVHAPLAPTERTALATWALSLEPVISDVVELVRQAPISVAENDMFFYSLSESKLVESQPQTISLLLAHVIGGAAEMSFECTRVDSLVRRLHSGGAETSILLEICDSMARLGCPTAAELRASIG